MINLKGFIAVCVLGLTCVVVPVNAEPETVVENNVVEKMEASGSVNINTATAELLALKLKGVGIKRAQAIVEYRSEYGPFQSAEQLQDIKGIGDVLIKQNVDKIRL